MTRMISALLLASIATIPGLVFFVALFWLGVLGNTIPVLMYRGIILACIACLAHSTFLWWLLRRHHSREYVILSALSLAFATNVIFLVVVPVTIDRSVSVYLLGQLRDHPAGMTEAELTDQLVHQYVKEYRGVSRRMKEQILSGNVSVSGDRYLLTPQGQTFVSFSDSVTDTFGVDPRYIRSPNAHTQPHP